MNSLLLLWGLCQHFHRYSLFSQFLWAHFPVWLWEIFGTSCHLVVFYRLMEVSWTWFEQTAVKDVVRTCLGAQCWGVRPDWAGQTQGAQARLNTLNTRTFNTGLSQFTLYSRWKTDPPPTHKRALVQCCPSSCRSYAHVIYNSIELESLGRSNMFCRVLIYCSTT